MKWMRRLFAFVIVWCAFTEAVQLFSRLFFHTWVAGDWFLIFLASDSSEMWDFVRTNPGPLITGFAVFLLGIIVAVVTLRLSRRGMFLPLRALGNLLAGTCLDASLSGV